MEGSFLRERIIERVALHQPSFFFLFFPLLSFFSFRSDLSCQRQDNHARRRPLICCVFPMKIESARVIRADCCNRRVSSADPFERLSLATQHDVSLCLPRLDKLQQASRCFRKKDLERSGSDICARDAAGYLLRKRLNRLIRKPDIAYSKKEQNFSV